MFFYYCQKKNILILIQSIKGNYLYVENINDKQKSLDVSLHILIS